MDSPGASQEPFAQSFNFTLSDGTQLTFSVNDLNFWYLDALQSCIQYASQIGASLILLLLLYLLTKPEKRLQPLFLLNSAALIFTFLRMLLSCLYFTGPFNDASIYFSLEWYKLPTYAFSIPITAAIFTALLHLVIQVSLLLQIQVVCITLRKQYRLALLISSAIIGGAAVAFRFYLAAINIKSILDPNNSYSILGDFSRDTDIITTAAIFWFSAVFVSKLGYALYQRKKLGLRRWGSMQIIFTMGCQTLIIPAIFSVAQLFSELPAISSYVLTLVAIFLPLSALWAGNSVDGNARPGIVVEPRRRITPSYGGSDLLGAGKSLSVSVDESTRCNSGGDSPLCAHFKYGSEIV